MALEKVTSPDPKTSELALQAARALAPLLGKKRPKTIKIRPEGEGKTPAVTVPLEAFELFVHILEQLAAGKSLVVVPYHAELTTQQAAELLGVSRPFLISLLEDKKIPFRAVGRHRRVRMEDLITYKKADDARREKVLGELAAEAQKLGLDY
jgi:excisionase family DNA binding protein